MVSDFGRSLFLMICSLWASIGFAGTRDDFPPALSARFTVLLNAQVQELYLRRTDTQIQTAWLTSGKWTLWTRSPEGEFNLQQVFMSEQRVVEYVSGELKTRRMVPDWLQLGSLVMPSMLDQARQVGHGRRLGRSAIHYRGKLAGDPADLWWLPGPSLPASFEWGRGKQAIVWQLRTITPAGTAFDEALLRDFVRMDAADLGDMEGDPFVDALLRESGHHH